MSRPPSPAVDLRRAVRALVSFGHPAARRYRLWKDALDEVETIIEALDLIDIASPGALHRLAIQALEDYELQQRPAAEVTALIARYARRIES